jgi:phosphoribosylamine-glycine ligase
MKTAQGVKVIEFNARFGDPETEVVLPLLESDAYDVFYGIATGLGLPSRESGISPFAWRNEATIGVVLASKGYPGDYAKGAVIEGVELFDIYRGPQVGENKKSVSLRVTLRASDRTLTIEEAEKVSAKILRGIEHNLGITLRA